MTLWLLSVTAPRVGLELLNFMLPS
jgi:hypothetical protein